MTEQTASGLPAGGPDGMDQAAQRPVDWWLAAVTVASMAATASGSGLGYRSHTPVATAAQILNNSLSGAILAQLLLGALGVLTVTSEYGTGMIRSTLAAVPRRRTVLAAKAAVCGARRSPSALLASFAGYLGGQLATRGTAIPAASLGDPGILRAVVLTGLLSGRHRADRRWASGRSFGTPAPRSARCSG